MRGAGGHVPPPPPEEMVSVLIVLRIIVGGGLGCFSVVWGGSGCFNGPHDDYANRSNSQTSLPHAIGRPTDSRTVLLRAVG